MVYAQKTTSEEKTVKGWDYGILPSFVYNTDKGLQYGALANIYYYGDSSQYPNYKYNLYLQCSLTTRRSYVNYLFFDSKYLLPEGIRFTADLSLIKNGFQQFYGLNGFDALYNHNYEIPSNPQYISRNYYHLRKTARTVLIDIQGKFPFPHFRWDLGIGYYNITTRPFNKNGVLNNKPTLFEKYVNNDVIPAAQKNGGITSYLKTGLVYDTRDNEAIPTKGVWIEAIYINAPQFLKNKFAYSQVAFIHRQYFTLFPDIIFAYRLAYQTKLNGEMPFYMLPYLISTFRTQEALGGVKTIRGILNQRVQGDGFALGNFELRYIFINTVLLDRNLSIALNTFTDMGKVTKQYNIDKSLNSTAFDYKNGNEKMHYGMGGGIRFIVNHNFIVSFDYGRALNKMDGRAGFYLDLDYLF